MSETERVKELLNERDAQKVFSAREADEVLRLTCPPKTKEGVLPANKGKGKPRNLPQGQSSGVRKADNQEEYEKKLRRKVEDRLRKDRQALLLVAKILDIE
jgi:hypothetical protein